MGIDRYYAITGYEIGCNLDIMAVTNKTRRVCPQGHTYYKSSDCPVCPECAALEKPGDGFLALFSAPARRALEQQQIATAEQLSRYTQADIMKLHGMGPASLPKMLAALKAAGLTFKK